MNKMENKETNHQKIMDFEFSKASSFCQSYIGKMIPQTSWQWWENIAVPICSPPHFHCPRC